MVYLLEVTKTCDDSLPLTISGNALDPRTLAFTCGCGMQARVNSAQEVGLDPADPGFQERVERILADFTSLSYYVVSVKDGVMSVDPRWRKSVKVEFHSIIECKTCAVTVNGVSCSQEAMNEFATKHKGHELCAHTVLDTDDQRIANMIKQATRRS